MKTKVNFLLFASIISFCLCACNTSASSSKNRNSEGGDAIPETEKANRDDLKYLNGIEKYKKDDWKAHWIWTQYCSEDSYVAFRKKFTLDENISSTIAYISAESKYFLWVNEKLTIIDGSLKRGPTPYDSYYDEVEITNLAEGENIIVILVAFNGRSGDGSINPTRIDSEGDEISQAGLLFEMQAGNTLIKSDNTFKASRIRAYLNKITGKKDYPAYSLSSMLAERNVCYDARQDIGDYRSLSFDDADWEKASSICKAGYLPFGDLYKAVTKPIIFDEVVDFSNADEYTGKTLIQDTKLELNLPTDIQFSWVIGLEAQAGQKLTIYTDSYSYNDGLKSFMDTYICKGGTQEYENYPWRSGYTLYIEAPAGVKFTKLGYRFSYFNGEMMPPVETSNADIDTLWKKAQNTVRVCMRDSFMDCPDRERGPYMGDASNQVDSTLYCYGEGGLDLIKKSILACIGWTKNDGVIPSRAPSVKPQEIPNQSLAFLTSAFHYWQHTKDIDTMKIYYKACLDYLKLFEMSNGLPVYRYGSWTWNDWGEKIDSNLLQVGFYYYALNLVKQLSEELEMNDDVTFIDERMASMKAKYHQAYYTVEGFKDSSSRYVDDRANALLALSGLAEPSDYETIINVLTSTFQASPFIEKYVIEALCYMGRIDLAMERMLNRYDEMIKDSKDTLYEKFDISDGTFNHAWSSGPCYIVGKYIIGLKPLKAGYEEFALDLTNLLTSYKSQTYTIKGNIGLNFSSDDDGSKTLKISSIAAKGYVSIPHVLGDNISVEGGNYTLQNSDNKTIVQITQNKEYIITIR
ncbi:MAG TPA: hypothetical protein GX010_02895 [Erysipelotrichaceae bacterium]|nr:hypothetical protein [Erysipelotrichaceae bacterium]